MLKVGDLVKWNGKYKDRANKNLAWIAGEIRMEGCSHVALVVKEHFFTYEDLARMREEGMPYVERLRGHRYFHVFFSHLGETHLIDECVLEKVGDKEKKK